MTDQEFDAYLATAQGELTAKQSYLEREFGLGRYERFAVDYEKETLRFLNDDRVQVAFSITPLGSHHLAEKSWRWAWANASLPEKMRRKAAHVQRLFDVTGFDLFRQSDVSIDESMAWEFVALSAKILGALGAYSMPQGSLRIYVLLDAPVHNG